MASVDYSSINAVDASQWLDNIDINC
ncbi:hypothetical protein PANT111_20022 [Pantoea brenneri]|uniref:Uncharacterized protein n=1 Tax=Pantoea brenneri TaxID=472694 RepID=A0AAX3J6I7_9GAMM|nr:hypothetical protein PANT111_20022 [Pantoea brenneri]